MLIVDTGPLVAAADQHDPDHAASGLLLEAHPGPLITTPMVITEAGWLIRRQLGVAAEAVLYAAISRDEIAVETLLPEDWTRMGELVKTYADIGLDAADASVIAIAERLGQDTIATLDERDFRIVRPRHIDAFILLPGSS